MSDIPKRYEHFLSPDGVRKLSQLMKSHFASYPDKDKLYNDSKGLQYNGSVYNFGSEILLETNKLKMTKPPIRNLTYGKDTTFYFDIDYSYLIDTYEQQNMLVCNLKKDVLVASHQYYLEFRNISEFYVIRSTNTSAGNKITPDSEKRVQQSIVFKDLFYKTNDFPVLVEKYTNENNEVVYVDHELRIRDGETFPTFYFHSNELTNGYIDSIVDGTLTTILLDDDMHGLPFIWFTTESFKYLPPIDLDNNIDAENHPFLTFGTDGNGVSRIYPNCYTNNFPPYDDSLNYEWYIKIESRDGFNFIADDEPGNKNLNYGVPIKSITLLYSNVVNKEPSDCVKRTITIPENANYVIYLDKNIYHTWSFSKRLPTDDDWDAVTFNNPNYAYSLYEADGSVTQRSFSGNHMNLGYMIAGFKIKFFNEYQYKWEPDLIGDVSGVHVDSTDERSNNGVVEKNGVSHMMGEFDGLPYYFQLQLDEKIHRSHVELYSIRDHINKFTQLPTDKQTSGLIVDSAIPQTQLPSFLYGDPCIIYNNEKSHEYFTLHDKIVSESNVLSNIVYVDNMTNVFSDRTNRGMKKYKQFFYHGNNYFSLDILSLNPSDEYGRGYIVSNDPAVYVNNDVSSYVKPGRTMAMICDIPTSIIHLTNVPNYAPSVLIDWNDSELSYVRMECNYSDDDKNRVLNDSNNLIKYPTDLVYPVSYDLSTILNGTGNRYKNIMNINQSITLTFGDNGNTEMTIVNGGSDYSSSGRGKFNIGGRYFIIEFTATDGIVTSISPNDPITYENINLANLCLRESIYHVTTIDGTGDGLDIKLTIDETIWNQHVQFAEDYRDGLYLYQYDEYNHIWIWTFDVDENKWNRHIQITGPNVEPNPYDLVDIDKRTIINAYMMNMLNNNRKIFYETLSSDLDSSPCMESYNRKINIHKTDLQLDDLSDKLNELNVNVQNTYFVITPDPDSDYSILEYHVRYPYRVQDFHFGPYHNLTLPRFNSLNLPTFFNTSNRLTYTIHRSKPNSQPDVLFYSPNETNVNDYNLISTDYQTLKSTHKMSLVDLIEDDLNHTSNLYITTENVYRYDEYSIPESFEKRFATLNGMSRDALLVYIRDTYGDTAVPLLYEISDSPFSKKRLIDYCMTIDDTLYHKSNIQMFAQKYQTVAQEIETDDGDKTIVPTDSSICNGLMKSISSNVSTLDYHSNNVEFESDVLFIFTIPKNEQLVSFKHFRMCDENGIDISKHSLLIYDGSKYLFNEMNDNWYVIE